MATPKSSKSRSGWQSRPRGVYESNKEHMAQASFAAVRYQEIPEILRDYVDWVAMPQPVTLLDAAGHVIGHMDPFTRKKTYLTPDWGRLEAIQAAMAVN